MKRQDWIDYFEAVNGRVPTAEEYAAAKANGEFEDEVMEAISVAPVTDAEETSGSTAPLVEAMTTNNSTNNSHPSKASEFLQKLRVIFGQHQKLILAILAVAAVAVVSLFVIGNQPKSLADRVELTFTGYDGKGIAEYSSQDIEDAKYAIALKVAGFNSHDIEDIINGDSITMSEIYANRKKTQNYNRAMSYVNSVQWNFDKTSGLSNGDKVTLKVSPMSNKSPFKKEEKTFEVKGLTEFEKLSQKDFLEKYPVKFLGFNGYAKVVLPKDENDSIIATSDANTSISYSNGDKITLKPEQWFLDTLEENGQALESDTIEVEVKDLPDINAVSNLAEAITKADEFAKSQHKSDDYTTYTIEQKNSYISYEAPYREGESGRLIQGNLYKVKEQGRYSDEQVTYKFFGYTYYVKSDNSLDLESGDKYSTYGSKDEEGFISELKSTGFREYSVE